MRSLHPLFRAATLVAALPLLAAAQRDGDRIDSTFPIQKGGSVQIGSVSGEIRVIGGNRSDVRVVASIDRGRFEVSNSASRVEITTRSVNNRQGAARIEVTVPVGTRVRARTVSGTVEVRATDAEVSVNSTSGRIEVGDARDRVEIATVSGDVLLARSSGRIVMNGVSGSLRADDVGGDLDAETVSGDIEVRRGRLTAMSAKTVSGDIAYAGGLAASGTYRLNAHSGSVTLQLPSDVGALLELETFSGRINSDFPLTMQPGETGGRRGRRMDFTLGAGGARVTAGAFSGNINIRRAAAAANRE